VLHIHSPFRNQHPKRQAKLNAELEAERRAAAHQGDEAQALQVGGISTMVLARNMAAAGAGEGFNVAVSIENVEDDGRLIDVIQEQGLVPQVIPNVSVIAGHNVTPDTLAQADAIYERLFVRLNVLDTHRLRSTILRAVNAQQERILTKSQRDELQEAVNTALAANRAARKASVIVASRLQTIGAEAATHHDRLLMSHLADNSREINTGFTGHQLRSLMLHYIPASVVEARSDLPFYSTGNIFQLLFTFCFTHSINT